MPKQPGIAPGFLFAYSGQLAFRAAQGSSHKEHQHSLRRHQIEGRTRANIKEEQESPIGVRRCWSISVTGVADPRSRATSGSWALPERAAEPGEIAARWRR